MTEEEMPVYDQHGKVVGKVSRQEIAKYGVRGDVRLQIDDENIVRAIEGAIRPGQYSLGPILTEETVRSAIERIQNAGYFEPRVPLHHPACDAVQPGADPDTPCSTTGCAL